MANTYHGKQVLGELSDGQTLPNAGTADSTNMVYIGGPTNGKLWIDVYALTALAVSSGNTLSIEFQSYSADTAASAIPPFSTTNKGGIPGASGTAESDAHMYLLHKTSADGALDISAGSLICQMAIPEDLCRLLSHDYVQITYLTDEDLSAQTVDAFVYIKL